MSALEYSDETTFEKQMFEKMKVLRETFLREVGEVLMAREWYMGYLSIADFFLYNVLIYFQGFVPSIVTEKSIERYLRRFESLEPLKLYFKGGKANYPPALVESVNRKWKGRKY